RARNVTGVQTCALPISETLHGDVPVTGCGSFPRTSYGERPEEEGRILLLDTAADWDTISAVPPAGRAVSILFWSDYSHEDQVPRSEEHTSELKSRFDLV